MAPMAFARLFILLTACSGLAPPPRRASSARPTMSVAGATTFTLRRAAGALSRAARVAEATIRHSDPVRSAAVTFSAGVRPRAA